MAMTKRDTKKLAGTCAEAATTEVIESGTSGTTPRSIVGGAPEHHAFAHTPYKSDAPLDVGYGAHEDHLEGGHL